MLLCCSAVAVLCAPVYAAGLSEGERGRALSELHASRKLFLDSLEGVSQTQWNFKPNPQAWSVGECAEHIALSEDMLFDLVTKKIMASPADPSKRAEVKGKDEVVLKTIADRSHKAQAPEMLQPKRTFASREALIQHFRESRERLLEYVRTGQDDLRVHFAPHPAAGLLDGYQWILLLSAHTARHTAQIQEVKDSPGYPK